MDELDESAPLRDALLIHEIGSHLRHALRNRLGAVRNAAFFVERRLRNSAPELLETDARLRSMLELIESEVMAAESLLAPEPRVERFLGAARGECDATRVTRSVIASLTATLDVSISLSLTEDLGVRASESLLTIALESVVENAVQAVAATGGHVCVTTACDDDGWVTIDVADDGLGVADSGLIEVSKAFQSTKDGRLGVGLARARRAALVWGGRLELAPCAPRGTRATLFLPAVSAPLFPPA